MFTRPELLYPIDALSPYISDQTLEFHSGKHHQTYVDNLNKLVVGTEFEDQSLEEIIKTSSGGIFNNAAQIWNHTFYFDSLCSPKVTQTLGNVRMAIDAKWGSLENFQIEFNKVALATFGSGWAWLVRKADGSLEIISTSNAATPLTTDDVALLTCDVWEHAYYIDYRNARAKYLENFWHVVNWSMVDDRYNAN
ncbi:superoxide dismutase [Candidatus Gracilibacteria bacterium]|nr:superoxide dismutase [Candidatus Gracilibacteria bacterium]